MGTKKFIAFGELFKPGLFDESEQNLVCSTMALLGFCARESFEAGDGSLFSAVLDLR